MIYKELNLIHLRSMSAEDRCEPDGDHRDNINRVREGILCTYDTIVSSIG